VSELKRGLGIDVLSAARQRIGDVFDHFDAVYVSFSGGKDSTVLLHLTMEEAIRRKRRVGVLFIDWEAQYRLTIEHVRDCLERYRAHIDPYWVALPLRTTNAVSMHEPEWICWDPAKRELWVREAPEDAITDPAHFDFYTEAMTFEEFVPEFGRWYARQHGHGVGALTASMVGIRADESLHRFATLTRSKATYEAWQWTTWIGGGATYNAYPIYDWRTADVWTYLGRTGKPYNALYDRMHQAGLSIHQMRICEPYGDEQRKGLWLFHLIEPESWGRIAARVAGANSGALYANEAGNVLGNLKVSLPDGHTWESFAHFLLDTMPPKTAEHYRNKIAVYVHYCQTHYGSTYRLGLPDAVEGDTGSVDVPSWRRICKVLLRNDYWCKGLSFSPTKTESYERYRKIMKRRRQKWRIL
jgi:predicted phosphoadenosine phosphosulfate sulfurtransferase